MTDTPNEQAPATRSEWLALMREAVRLEMAEEMRLRIEAFERQLAAAFAPQPPSGG